MIHKHGVCVRSIEINYHLRIACSPDNSLLALTRDSIVAVHSSTDFALLGSLKTSGEITKMAFVDQATLVIGNQLGEVQQITLTAKQ